MIVSAKSHDSIILFFGPFGGNRALTYPVNNRSPGTSRLRHIFLLNFYPSWLIWVYFFGGEPSFGWFRGKDQRNTVAPFLEISDSNFETHPYYGSSPNTKLAALTG